MKKTTLILTLAVVVFSCSRKSLPAASAGSSPSGNSGTVISGNAPAAASSGSATSAASTPAVLPAEGTGAKTPASPSTTSSPEVQGMATFNSKCGKCHGLKPASDYTADRWANIMQVMAPKARLTDTEKENVLAYVRANAKK